MCLIIVKHKNFSSHMNLILYCLSSCEWLFIFYSMILLSAQTYGTTPLAAFQAFVFVNLNIS